MNSEKWNKYLRQNLEPGPTSEQEDNMKYFGQPVIEYASKCEDTPVVLDIGCGTGMFVHWLNQNNIDAVGVTLKPNDIETGRKRYDKIKLTLGDMHELPFSKDKIFNVVHSKDVYEHAISPFIAMCEVNRVLKIGGLCYIVIPGPEWIKCDYHYSLLNEAQMTEMFRKCNFSLDKVEKHKAVVGSTVFSCYCAFKKGDISL